MEDKEVLRMRVDLLKALADPKRMEIIEFLKDRERCVCEIIPLLGRSQSTTSKNLDVLFRAGVLDRRTEGKKTIYWIRSEKIRPFLKDLDSMNLERLTEAARTARAIGRIVARG